MPHDGRGLVSIDLRTNARRAVQIARESLAYWIYGLFAMFGQQPYRGRRVQGNAAMRLRNAVLKPEFVMYYLTFLLPEAQVLLQRHGFQVKVANDVFQGRLARLQLVIATKG